MAMSADPVAPAPAAAEPDDLTKIEGIGPKIAGLMNGGGIATFAQLAASSVDGLQEILNAAGDRYRVHDPASWPMQAGLAADGKWDKLGELQDRLDGGKLS
jgi:large subunit ribosomal protein L17